MALIVKSSSRDDGAVEKWVEYDNSTKILIRTLDYDPYQIGLARARRQIDKADAKFGVGEVGVVDGEITEHAYQCRLLSMYIVKDWQGVKDENGNEVKYESSVCESVLRSNIEFFLFVIKSASEIAVDVKKEIELSVGKS